MIVCRAYSIQFRVHISHCVFVIAFISQIKVRFRTSRSYIADSETPLVCLWWSFCEDTPAIIGSQWKYIMHLNVVSMYAISKEANAFSDFVSS